MTRNLSAFVIAFLLVLSSSCDEDRIIDKYKTLGQSWHQDSIVSFAYNLKNINQPVNLFVNIRSNNDYKYSNLYLIASMEHPNGYTKVDTLQYLMANPDGSLLGDGFLDVKESRLFYKENVRFLKTGIYKVRLQQAVRKTGKVTGEKILEGITDIGFRIEKTTANKN